jgi:hypothetical protein
VFWRFALLGMEHRQAQRGVFLLFADRWQNPELAVLDLENSLVRLTSIILNLDAMKPLTATSSISSATVWPPSPASRSTHVRMRKCVPISCAAQKTYMNAPFGISEQFGRLSHIFQPPDAFLFIDRHPCWIYFLLQCVGSFEFLPGAELGCDEAER